MKSYFKRKPRLGSVPLTVGIVLFLALLTASSAFADGHRTLSLSPMIGTAGGGFTIDRTGGGSFEIEDNSGAAIGARLMFEPTRQSETGPRFALMGDVNWHNLSATKTDATLGQVRFEADWSAAISGRAGYDFGRLEPYISLGIGLTDASLGTNGSSPDSRISAAPSLGFGLDAALNDTWGLSVDVMAITTPEFTPEGGGGKATGGVGTLRLGLTGTF